MLHCNHLSDFQFRSISNTIIVVGGKNSKNDFLSSTEILNENMNGWIEGPRLPFGIKYAQIVEEPGGGVILVGGVSSQNDHLNTLFKLSHAGNMCLKIILLLWNQGILMIWFGLDFN